MSEMNGRRLIARWWVKIPQLMGTVVHPIISHYWQRFIHPDSRSLLSQQICRCLPIYIYISYVHMSPCHRNGLEVVHAPCTWSNRQRARSRRPRCAWIVQCKEVQIWYSKNSENNGGGVVEGVVLGGVRVVAYPWCMDGGFSMFLLLPWMIQAVPSGSDFQWW